MKTILSQIFRILAILFWFAIMIVAAVAGETVKVDLPIPAPGEGISMLILPSADGFSPNVNVLSVPMYLTFAEHFKAASAELREAGMTVDLEKVGAADATFEYRGKVAGNEVRGRQRLVAKAGNVTVITGTVLASQPKATWEEIKKRTDCIADSLLKR